MVTESTSPVDAEAAPILLVDDTPGNIIALETILDDPGYAIDSATSGVEALRYLMERDYAVLLLDVRMPGMDGFELARVIKQRERTKHTPIVFLTAEAGGPAQIAEGYAAGAVDYIQKPLMPEIVRSKVRVFVSLFQKEKLLRRQADLLLRTEQAENDRRLSALRQANEARLRDLVEAMPQLVWMAEPDGGIVLHNARWREYSGLGGEAAHTPGNVTSVLHPSDADVYWSRWELSRRNGTVFECEVRLRRASDGAYRWHLCRAVPRRGEGGSVELWLGTYTDVHSQKSADIIKDEFLATLSHELRTPLNVILGWLDLLRTAPPGQIDVGHVLGILDRNARLQVRLISDLLDLSRILTGKLRLEPGETALSEVVRASASSLDVIARNKSVTLTVDVTPDAEDAIVFGDASRLQQAVWNLLSNGIKFTPRGGAVTVELRRECDALHLAVRDTGDGIAPDFLPHVFDRFRQEDSSSTRAHGGLGLGLSIVRNVIELHGGKVTAHSAGKGCGATFVIEIPLAGIEAVRAVEGTHATDEKGAEGSCQAVARERHAPRRGASSLSHAHGASPAHTSPQAADTPRVPAEPSVVRRALEGLKILLVDDSEDTVDLVKTVLEEQGARVVTAPSAAKALDALQARPPHVLVSDIGMPGENGLDLVARLKASQRNKTLPASIAAVALTAYARESDARLALEAGFDAYLTKPIDRGRLVETIRAFGRMAVEAPAPTTSPAAIEGASWEP